MIVIRIRSLLLLCALLVTGCSSSQTSTGESAVSSCPGGSTIKGVDVSHSNGKIDWVQAKSEGIQFVFVKATEGTTFVDPNFHTNWTGLRAAGIVRGAYHYFRPNVSASDQASFVANTVGALEANDLPIVCDFEELDGVSSSNAIAAAIEFMNDVTKLTGKQAIVYTFPKFLSSYGGLVKYPLWAASYGHSCPTLPPGFKAWDFWQTADQGGVANVHSTVDQDEFNGSLEDLLAYANRSAGDGHANISDAGSDGVAATSCTLDGRAFPENTCTETLQCDRGTWVARTSDPTSCAVGIEPAGACIADDGSIIPQDTCTDTQQCDDGVWVDRFSDPNACL